VGQTLAEKILSHKVGRPVRAGELVVVEVDQVMVVDSIAGSFFKRLEYLEATPRYPERVSIVIDHVAPASMASYALAMANPVSLWPWNSMSTLGPTTRRTSRTRA